MTGVVLGAMALLGALVSRQSRASAHTLVKAMHAQKLQQTQARINGLLEAAERQGRMCAALTPAGGVEPRNFLATFERLAAAFVEQKEFTYLGYAVARTGEYVMLERLSGAVCRLREYRLMSSGERVVVNYRITREGFVQDGTVPWDGYDPRERPFYAVARDSAKAAWTPTYLFKGNEWRLAKMGVSHVVPVRDASGELVGVWDVDFDMDALAAVLRDIATDATGYAFILEEAGELAAPVLVAHPELRADRDESGVATKDPVVAELLSKRKTAPRNGLASDAYRLEHDGKVYLAACQRLAATGPPWSVAVIFDESVALAGVAQNRAWILLVVLGVTGVAVMTAAWLAHVLWRPVEQLRVAAEKLAAGGDLPTGAAPVEGPRELARLAETFNTMAAAVETRRRELQAANLRLQEEVRQRGLREAELEAVFANAPVEIWAVDLAGRYTLQSRRLRERCGDGIGRTPAELALPREVIEAYTTNNRRALAGEIVRGETAEGAEGQQTHYHWIVAPIRIGGLVTGALGVSIDVTERRRAEDALQRSQQRLRLHLENTPLAVIDWSLDFTVLSWNPAAEAVFGWSTAEALGRSGMFIVPEHERAQVRQMWADLLARSGGYRHYHQNTTRDARVIDSEWYNTVLTDEHEKVIGVSSLVLDVSQRLGAEALFRESEERFLHVFKASPIAMVISRREDGRLIDVNDRFLLMSDYRREEVLGRTGHELGLWENPGDRERLLEILLRDGEILDRESRLRPRKGPPVDVIVSAAAVPLGADVCLLITFVDNTERKRAENTLRENQRFLSVLISHLPGMVYRCRNDRDWTITFASDGATALTGYTPAELEHSRVAAYGSLIHPEDQNRIWNETQAALSQGRKFFSYEYRIVHRDGSIRWVWERGEAQIEADGKALNLVGFVTDISERKRAEDEVLMLNLSLEHRVEERTGELAAANEKLKELDRLKSQFLAMMSHELRTPLNSIIGFSSILRQGMAGPLNPEQTKQIDMVRGSARHLLTLINDLLDLSQIESGRMELALEEFDLLGVLAEVENVLAPMVAQRALTYTTLAAAETVMIRSDRKRLFQVVLNLANNAVKFTERGGVMVNCSTVDGEVHIAVNDTGIGIKAEHMALLFEAFRQVDGSARRIYEGTGLGLHLCRKLLDLLGGRVEVQSVHGEGSCFTVSLPLIAVKPAASIQA